MKTFFRAILFAVLLVGNGPYLMSQSAVTADYSKLETQVQPSNFSIFNNSKFRLGLLLEAGYSGSGQQNSRTYTDLAPAVTTESFQQKIQPAFSGGIHFAYALSERWELELGVNYRHLGDYGIRTYYVDTNGSGQNNANDELTYSIRQQQLGIPLLTSFYFAGADKKIRPYIKAGPQISRLLRQTYAYTVYSDRAGADTYTLEYGEQVDFSMDATGVKRWEYSLVSSVGFTLKRMSIGLQMVWDFQANDAPDYKSYNPLPDCESCSPAYTKYPIEHLYQTSIRLAYRLF